MGKMINLRDLLTHEVQDLYSAEEQIIEALPLMIEKAGNAQLKKALQDHLKVTENQIARLDEVKQLLENESGGEENNEGEEESKGFLGGLFGGGKSSNGKHTCLGMQGVIKEGQKVMGEDMSPEVLDAAIIACAQKVEHYEICGYGTARAYARELNLGDVAELLEETLNEEYEADDLLTDLAVGKLNEKAESGSGGRRGGSGGGRQGTRNSSGRGSDGARGRNSGGRGSKGASKKSASKSASKTAAKGASKSASKGASKGASKSAGRGSGPGRSSGSGGGRSKAASKGGRATASKSSSGGAAAKKGAFKSKGAGSKGARGRGR
jgi:ferritin-like metal-binding protein YciE